jgi:hypothetical protein
MKEIGKWEVMPQIKIITKFYQNPDYISCVAKSSEKYNWKDYDHVLFSFHGIPERQIKRTDFTDCCLKENCCGKITAANEYCYKAGCYETARNVAKEIGIPLEKYSVSFQSRLGRDPWIKPYSDKVIEETQEIEICKKNDLNYTTALSVVHLQCDLITYFKKYIYENVRYNLDQHTLSLGYQVPFDPKKTILVHLRLEDVRTWPHYDGRVCCGHYADRINRGEQCEYTSFGWHHNRQTPMPVNIVQRQIDAALVKYPEHEVIIITSPGDYGTGFSYRDIRSNDENYDLFLLCNSEVVVLSRSNFSLCSLFYGIVQEAYVPMWGHLSCLGPCTKYDNCKFNYYF